MKRRRKTKELEQVNLLQLAPVRLAPWSEAEGRVVIERAKPTGAGKVGEKIRYWLAVRKIRLDEKGSHVWKLLDGTRSVADVATAMRQEFGSEVEPAEERIGQLVRMLHKEDLLAYPGWDEASSSPEC